MPLLLQSPPPQISTHKKASIEMLAFLWVTMVRVDGIEPTTSAWKADVLPLNYTRVIEARKMPSPIRVGQDRNSENLVNSP